MSYLLDALRKAERERNLGRVPEFNHSNTDSAEGSGRRLPLWVAAIVLGLVALNLLLLATFWWVNRGPSAPNIPAGLAAMDSAPVLPGTTAPPPAATQELSEQKPTQTVTQSLPDPAPEPQSIPQSQPAQAAPVRSREQDKIISQPQPPPTSEIYDKPSLEQPGDSDEIEHYNALAPSERAQLPEVQINGHLYSSIPGRSFVLVNGLRYHEGQRLPEGPAIVIIDEQGAIFNYRDIRYRLDAPR